MQLKIERLDHLPVIAGTIKEIGLIEKIDALIPPHPEEKLTTGQSIAALILCGMGFLQKPLYLTPHFFENRPVSYLLGDNEIEANDLNHWKLGRELENCFNYGVEALFAKVSGQICSELEIPTVVVHADTTTFSFHGDYEDQDDQEVQITYGYSKAQRPDLKQIVWETMVSPDSGIPLLCSAWSGNENDSQIFHQRLTKLAESFATGQSPESIVFDCKGYSQRNQPLFEQICFVSRMPATYKAHDEWIDKAFELEEWQDIGEKQEKFWQEFESENERVIVVYSKASENRAHDHLEKAAPKELAKLEKILKSLQREQFNCSNDAEKAAIERFAKTTYHKVENIEVEEVRKHKQSGRPKAGSTGEVSHWRVKSANIVADAEKQMLMRLKGSCYVLVSNIAREKKSAEEIMEMYSNQNHVERGFRFLKDPLFFTSSLFLKKPARVQGLLMVMTLGLLVYSLAERKLRRTLAELGETLPNQLKKPTATPTLRWVFQMLDGINRVQVTLPGQDPQVMMEGLNELKTKAIRCFGPVVCEYYLISNPEACSM